MKDARENLQMAIFKEGPHGTTFTEGLYADNEQLSGKAHHALGKSLLVVPSGSE
jgi:hypothetical protein